MVYSEQEVARMISELRNSGHSLKQISSKIAFECCTNYNCKDNVTVLLIDLRRHFADFHARARKSQRRVNSQIRPMDGMQMFAPQDLSFYTQMQQKFNPLLMPNQVKQHWSP
jgi:serine/threonine protein phosphatase PrpC